MLGLGSRIWTFAQDHYHLLECRANRPRQNLVETCGLNKGGPRKNNNGAESFF
jgi:hypothetical protein